MPTEIRPLRSASKMCSDVIAAGRTPTSGCWSSIRRRAIIAPPSLPWQKPSPMSDGSDANSDASVAAMRSKPSAALSTSRASPSSRSPAGVSSTRREVRANSVRPSSDSSSRMRCDSGGVDMWSRAAARPKWHSSATATKYRRRRRSTPFATSTTLSNAT